MNVLPILRAVCGHYLSRRGVGHTRAVLKGAEATGATVVCLNRSQAMNLGVRNYMALEDLPDALRGRTTPLVFDNHALLRLLQAAAEEISELRHQLRKEE